MNVDLRLMHKAPEADAKWQLLPPTYREFFSFEFVATLRGGSQEWDLTDIIIRRLEDGRALITAQVSMKFGEFAFAFFPITGKSILIDFHLYEQSFESITLFGQSVN